MLKDEYKVYEEKMRKSIDSVAADFAAVRAGRANAHPADRVHRLARSAPAAHSAVGRERREAH